MNIFLFMISCILTNNFIFSKFLGCCPFLGVSSKVETAASVMTISAILVFVFAPQIVRFFRDDDAVEAHGLVKPYLLRAAGPAAAAGFPSMAVGLVPVTHAM